MKARHLSMKQTSALSVFWVLHSSILVNIHVKNTSEGIHMYKYTVIPSISYMYMWRFPCGVMRTKESLYVRLIGNFFIFLLILLAVITIEHHGLDKKTSIQSFLV